MNGCRDCYFDGMPFDFSPFVASALTPLRLGCPLWGATRLGGAACVLISPDAQPSGSVRSVTHAHTRSHEARRIDHDQIMASYCGALLGFILCSRKPLAALPTSARDITKRQEDKERIHG